MNNFICFTRIENVRSGQCLPLMPVECETIIRKDDIAKIIHVPYSAGDTFNPGHNEGYELHTKSGDIFKISEWTFNDFKNLIITEKLNRVAEETLSVCGRYTTASPSEQTAPKDDAKADPVLSIKIPQLGLSVRVLSCLKSIGVETLGDITEKRKIDLIKIRGFGKHCLEETEKVLEKYNLKFKSL